MIPEEKGANLFNFHGGVKPLLQGLALTSMPSALAGRCGRVKLSL